jgi:hypothetical protein
VPTDAVFVHVKEAFQDTSRCSALSRFCPGCDRRKTVVGGTHLADELNDGSTGKHSDGVNTGMAGIAAAH